MQEARSAAYFTHYTHHIWEPESPGFGSWLVIALADATAADAPLIPPKIHDLYNRDIDMRKLERQLRVLPDRLNSCLDTASN